MTTNDNPAYPSGTRSPLVQLQQDRSPLQLRATEIARVGEAVADAQSEAEIILAVAEAVLLDPEEANAAGAYAEQLILAQTISEPPPRSIGHLATALATALDSTPIPRGTPLLAAVRQRRENNRRALADSLAKPLNAALASVFPLAPRLRPSLRL